jgi:hypothetical protein
VVNGEMLRRLKFSIYEVVTPRGEEEEYDIVSLGSQLPTFRENVVPSSSRPRALGIDIPVTQHRITKE